MTAEISFDTESPDVARLAGPLTFATCTGLYRKMEQRLERGTPIDTLDLDAVTRVDSAGLALLLEWQARRVAKGGRLRMENAPPGLIQLARLSNAVDLLDVTGKDGAG